MHKSSNKTDEIIQSYIALGWNVFPVASDKRPAISWKEYQNKKITLDKYKELNFQSVNKIAGSSRAMSAIAVITGKTSGITVIDVDIDKGARDPFPNIKTPKVLTGNKGYHYYFKYTDKVTQGQNNKTKVDIRNDGGYALLPPSKTKYLDNGEIKGGEYKWLIPPTTELAELPQDFIDSYSGDVVNYKSAFNNVSDGGRNVASVGVVGKLLREHSDNEQLAWEGFVLWNKGNRPPIEDDQLRATFNWCLNKHRANNPPLEEATSFADMEIEDILDFKQRPTAVTGIKKIDDRFEHPSGFYIICANPGVGKGWYALWLSRMFNLYNKLRSVYFSLEMPKNMVTQRILQQWSDLTEKQFKSLLNSKKYKDLIKAVDLLKQDVIRIDEFGGSDTSFVTPDNFKTRIEDYINKGFRVFHFDHLHELDGANDNTRNQGVTEKWAKVFQNISKEHEDIWLFVYVQPNGASAQKEILKRTDIAGSKAITQKCEFFISLNRKVADPRDFNADNVEEDRTVLIWIDKNRISSLQHAGFNLYFDYTTNYIDPNNKETYLDFGKPHNPYT